MFVRRFVGCIRYATHQTVAIENMEWSSEAHGEESLSGVRRARPVGRDHGTQHGYEHVVYTLPYRDPVCCSSSICPRQSYNPLSQSLLYRSGILASEVVTSLLLSF